MVMLLVMCTRRICGQCWYTSYTLVWPHRISLCGSYATVNIPLPRLSMNIPEPE